MANYVCVKYDTISLFLSKLKQAVAYVNPEKVSIDTFIAEIFPSRFNKFGNFPIGTVNFIDIKRNHTIYVSFKKKSDPITATDYMVTFQDIKKSHTLHALFEYKPWPLLDKRTILLLHFGGEVGSREIIDSSYYKNQVSLISSSWSVISATQRKWGKTSLILLGRTTGDLADCPFVNWGEGTLEGAESYTIDFWFYCKVQTVDIFESGRNFFRVGKYRFALSSYDTVRYLDICVDNSAANRALFPTSVAEYFVGYIRVFHVAWTDYPVDEWAHIAFVSDQGLIKIYINGVALSTTLTFIPEFYNYLYICENIWGFLDEFRVSIGARWTSNFIPPVGPYSNELELDPLIEINPIFDSPLTLSVNMSAGVWDAKSFIKLLAHFDGTENSTLLIDSSIYKHPMEAIDTAHLTGAGNVVEGDCGLFSGKNYLSLNDYSGDFNFSVRDFTIDFWVKLDEEVDRTKDNSLRIGFFGKGSYPNSFYMEFQWDTQMKIVVHVGDKSIIFTNNSLLWNAWWDYDPEWYYNTISNGKFSHVALVVKDGITYVHVNGVQLECPYSNVGTNGYQFTYTNLDSLFTIGVSGLSSTAFLKGSMKNFRVSPGISRWIGQFEPPTTYVLDTFTKLFIPMSGTLGSTTFTNTGSGFYAINNSYSVVISSTVNPFGNSAIIFNGTSDYVEVPDSNDWYFGVKDFTIDFRMKLILRRVSGQSIYLSATQPLFSQGIRGTDNYIGLDYEYSPLNSSSTVSTPRFVLHIGQTTRVHLFLSAYHASLPDDEKWHHIAVISYQRKIGFYYDGKGFANSEIYKDPDNTASGFVVFPDIGASFLIGSDKTYFYRGYIDEFRIQHRAEWLTDFNPPIAPYEDPIPNLPPGFNEVTADFSMNFFMEVEILKPGEIAIGFYENMSLEVIPQIYFGSIEFNITSEFLLLGDVVEVHFDFVFSNFWKKEILDSEYVNTDVEGDYRVALLNPFFEFDPDVHEFFIDQADEYEIVQRNGYVSNIPLSFKEFTSDGLLSFYNLLFPIAHDGIYGPVKSLLIYDYAMNVKGQIVGCLTFDQPVSFDQSTIELSDLSFQIV